MQTSLRDFQNTQGLSGHFKYNEKTGLIEGSSTNLGILANQILQSPLAGKDKRWLPTIREGITLDNAKRLYRGVYRDWGIAVYFDERPNSEVAQSLIQRGYSLPFLASFKDLRLNPAKNAQGLEIVFVDEPTELIQGEEAQRFLKENNFYTNNSGACGVGRDDDANLVASWINLAVSDGYGQVDFVCAEGTHANLQ